MDLYTQGYGRLAKEIKIQEIISEGKPTRIIFNSIAVYRANNPDEPFWIDVEVWGTYALKFAQIFNKGDKLSFMGYLENRTVKLEGKPFTKVVMVLVKAERIN